MTNCRHCQNNCDPNYIVEWYDICLPCYVSLKATHEHMQKNAYGR